MLLSPSSDHRLNKVEPADRRGASLEGVLAPQMQRCPGTADSAYPRCGSRPVKVGSDREPVETLRRDETGRDLPGTKASGGKKLTDAAGNLEEDFIP
ncbi:hypothetical protein [Nakamurella aerolata]|uniref:Uncharacterized protein n=1 Tax=Nakamurella aerolata TaxID=1656892 RepID=A0A849ADU1_9ACTN|nr:hypothetical protein [Nakamurella aerolata]NNG35042.1 hypothetical protein [Nakamurella aerolata]